MWQIQRTGACQPSTSRGAPTVHLRGSELALKNQLLPWLRRVDTLRGGQMLTG
jgi:hypothetical protein